MSVCLFVCLSVSKKFQAKMGLKVPMKRIFFIILFERAFKMIKNGIYFIVIALVVAELFKILLYAK